MPLPLIGVTSGDPAGIGPEICLRLLGERSILRECTPVVFADAPLLERVAAACRLSKPSNVITLSEWQNNPNITKAAVIDCGAIDAARVQPGAVSAECGRAAYAYIEEAINSAQQGWIAAAVTAPIHKESLSLAGIQQPGHTEIFTELTQTKRSCMMLAAATSGAVATNGLGDSKNRTAADELAVSFVTTHVGYADVPERLSVERILDVIELTAEAISVMHGRPAKLSVCGLNPHAGEHGLFGRSEEEQFIAPAIDAAREKGIEVVGPVPPDTAFVPRLRAGVDAIICMYHDQGHIPIKMLAFDSGVNVTLGLPIIRTSVDHGTAFDIAWQGRANPQSLYHAVRMAVRFCESPKPFPPESD